MRTEHASSRTEFLLSGSCCIITTIKISKDIFNEESGVRRCADISLGSCPNSYWNFDSDENPKCCIAKYASDFFKNSTDTNCLCLNSTYDFLNIPKYNFSGNHFFDQKMFDTFDKKRVETAIIISPHKSLINKRNDYIANVIFNAQFSSKTVAELINFKRLLRNQLNNFFLKDQPDFKTFKYKKQREGDNSKPTSIIEIKKIEGIESVLEPRVGGSDIAEKIIVNFPQEFYGIIAEDECFEYVTKKIAKSRLRNRWGSRIFFSCIVLKQSIVFINLKETCIGKNYCDDVEKLQNDKPALRKWYHEMKPCIAGLDHTILHSVEKCLILSFQFKEYFAKGILLGREKEAKGILLGRENDFKSINELIANIIKSRKNIIGIIEKMFSNINELEKLDEIIFIEHGLMKRREELEFLLSLQAEELSVLYQRLVDGRMRKIAIYALIVAIMTGLISLVALFCNKKLVSPRLCLGTPKV